MRTPSRAIAIAISTAMPAISVSTTNAHTPASASNPSPSNSLAPQTLSYIDCSTGLIDQPPWEDGDTEFEMEDLNGDGNVDLISIGDHGNPLIGSGEQGIMVWLGDGRGNWSYRHAGNLGYGGVACGDLDGDGTIDVAYAMHHNYGSGDFGDQLIEAARGDGTGSGWTPWDDRLAVDGQTYGMFSTDLLDADGDGDLDIASASFGYGQGMHVYLNRVDGTWGRSFGYLGDNSGNALTTGDIDGDGAPDIAAAVQSGTNWLGDGDGFFVAADGNLPAPGGFGFRKAVSLGDVDGDGRDDLAFCDASGAPQVWLARGVGVWSAANTGLPHDGGCQRTQLEEMDGDGSVDLVMLGKGKLRVFAGNGGTSWSTAATVQLPDSPGDAVALRTGRDIDHNGRADIVLVEDQQKSFFSTQNKVRCLRESSTPSTLTVRVVRPALNRTLRAGTMMAIEWLSAVPGTSAATVAIEFSANGTVGPWRMVASGRVDSGRFAWLVPPTLCSDCRIRVTITTSAGSATAVGPRFTIATRPDPLVVNLTNRDTVMWSDGLTRERHHLYRGDWDRFRATGEYTQDPAVVPGAARFCAIDSASSVNDPFTPAPGHLAFYLVSAVRLVDDGQSPGTKVPMEESPLGQRSGARMRGNRQRCP